MPRLPRSLPKRPFSSLVAEPKDAADPACYAGKPAEMEDVTGPRGAGYVLLAPSGFVGIRTEDNPVPDPSPDLLSDYRPRLAIDGPLVAWRDRDVVLLAGREGDRWVVARGWRDGDRLAHVRRWTFPTALRLAGQLRRLVREATGDDRHAAWVAAEALVWGAKRPSAELTPHDGLPADAGSRPS